MKKVLFILAAALFIASCEETEIETTSQEQKVEKPKKDPNFEMDKTQTGKGETR